MSNVVAKPSIIDFGYEKETVKIKVSASSDISSVTITVPDWVETTGLSAGVLSLSAVGAINQGSFYITPANGIFTEKVSHAITIDGTLDSSQVQVLWTYDASMMSLDDIIDDMMVQRTEDSFLMPLKKHQLMSIASRGMRLFSFDGMQKRRLVEAKLDDTGRIPFPFDMIKLIRASVVDENGYLSPIYTDDNMNRAWSHVLDENGYLVTDQNGYAIDATGLTPQSGNTGSNYSGSYKYSEGRQYGVSGGVSTSSGAHAVDLVGHEMVFADTPSDNIVIEYLSDPILLHNSGIVEGGLGVHKFYQGAMEAFIYWTAISKRSNVPMNEKIRAEQDYVNQDRLAKRRFINLDEIFQATKAGVKHMKY